MDALKAVKSVQEQAVASWINYLNQMRIDRLMDALTKEQENLDNAIDTITETLTTISREIVHNGLGRGGEKGIHGFIAEVAEVGIDIRIFAALQRAVPPILNVDIFSSLARTI